MANSYFLCQKLVFDSINYQSEFFLEKRAIYLNFNGKYKSPVRPSKI